MKVGAGLSILSTATEAAGEATGSALRALEGRPVDLALVFASPHHAPAAEDLLRVVHEIAGPAGLIGCVAEAVVGGRKEIEDSPALSVWLGSLPGGAETFHQEFVRTQSGGAFGGWRFEPGDPAHPEVHLMMCDPLTFPVDLLLRHLNEHVPGALVMGGMASGARAVGSNLLFHDRSVYGEGAVGVRLAGAVEVRALVSQGCRPIGGPYVVTRAEDNLVLELGGKPPLERLREILTSLAPPDRELASHGLHVGRVIDEYKAEHEVGDFLVRGLVGADPNSGALAVGDEVEVGQTIRFHVRDAATADEELRTLLQREAEGLRGTPAGAILFTCNGRGRSLFSEPDHDAGLVSSMLGDLPLAGFFCAGELGPVGGRNFVHGFTASLALFVDGPDGANRDG
jgi:small ligand-binding sensory domain FIST